MPSKVAIIDLKKTPKNPVQQALQLIGKKESFNARKPVVIKVGVFNHKAEHHATVETVASITGSFPEAPRIYVAESDNYKGTALERLQIWKSLFSERVVPFSLSEDTNVKQFNIAGEKIGLSHVFFEPRIFVSTHVMRVADLGSVLKNLLGVIPDRKKVRFHKKLPQTLMDVYEAVGGIDLAVLDGTYTYSNLSASRKDAKQTDVLLIGDNAVAVESLGASLLGINPAKMPIVQEAVKRGLGEGNVENIEVVGESMDNVKARFEELIKKPKKRKK